MSKTDRINGDLCRVPRYQQPGERCELQSPEILKEPHSVDLAQNQSIVKGMKSQSLPRAGISEVLSGPSGPCLSLIVIVEDDLKVLFSIQLKYKLSPSETRHAFHPGKSTSFPSAASDNQ